MAGRFNEALRNKGSGGMRSGITAEGDPLSLSGSEEERPMRRGGKADREREGGRRLQEGEFCVFLLLCRSFSQDLTLWVFFFFAFFFLLFFPAFFLPPQIHCWPC